MLMLAGARRSSDQLGFWSHSKSAVVCRCRNRLLSRPERPPGGRRNPSTAIIGCLPLSLGVSETGRPAPHLLPPRPARQPSSRLSSTRELRSGRGPVSSLVRRPLSAGGRTELASPSRSTNGRVTAETERAPARLAYQLTESIYFRFPHSTRPTLVDRPPAAATAPR